MVNYSSNHLLCLTPSCFKEHISNRGVKLAGMFDRTVEICTDQSENSSSGNISLFCSTDIKIRKINRSHNCSLIYYSMFTFLYCLHEGGASQTYLTSSSALRRREISTVQRGAALCRKYSEAVVDNSARRAERKNSTLIPNPCN